VPSRGGAAGLVGIAVLIAAGWDSGQPAEHVRFAVRRGVAGFQSGSGSSLLSTARLPRSQPRCRSARAATQLDAVQYGATAYAVDRNDRRDPARGNGGTFELTPPAAPIPAATAGLHVFAGPDTLYALDTERGLFHHGRPEKLWPVVARCNHSPPRSARRPQPSTTTGVCGYSTPRPVTLVWPRTGSAATDAM